MGGNSDTGPQQVAPEGRRKRESITISYEARDHLASVEVDPSLLTGAGRAVNDCLHIHPNERVVMVVESDFEHIAAALLQAAEARGAEVVAYVITEGQAQNDAFVQRLSDRLVDADASFLVCGIGVLPRAFRRKVITAGGQRRRHGHMAGITEAMMQQSMRAPFDEVQALGDKLLARLDAGAQLRVETSTGTDLTVRLSPEHRWVNESGVLSAPGWTNLPGGEVYTTPLSVDGVAVSDGGIWLPDGSEVGRQSRMRLRFDKGFLVEASGTNAAETEGLLDLLDSHDNGRRVGRVGLGTNTGVLTSIGALLQDLKMPGCHLTLGHTERERTGAAWSSELEVPVLIRRPHLSLDGVPIMVRGRYATSLA